MASQDISATNLTDCQGEPLIVLFESGKFSQPIKLMGPNEAAHLTLNLLNSLDPKALEWVIKAAARDTKTSNIMLISINEVKVQQTRNAKTTKSS